jgi:hypothetical protein
MIAALLASKWHGCKMFCLFPVIYNLIYNLINLSRYIHNDLNGLNLDDTLIRLGVKNYSLWTIDIAHICSIKNLKHSMYTITWGVEESYVNEDFYSKEREFTFEKKRIGQLFQQSSQLGINIVQQSVGLDFIKSEMSNKKCVCIVLVDANLLNGKNIDSDDDDQNDTLCLDMSDENVKSSSNKCCFSYTNNNNNDNKEDVNKKVQSKNNYLGHFIVLIGYDDLRNIIFYRNPATNKKLSITSYNNLEMARKSYGTDQDILFIYKDI